MTFCVIIVVAKLQIIFHQTYHLIKNNQMNNIVLQKIVFQK
jgi:hypothetical protein